jgi:hypothetical protein
MADAAAAAPFDATKAAEGYSSSCLGNLTATLTDTKISDDSNDCSWTVTYTFTISDDCGSDPLVGTYSNTGGDKTAPTLSGVPADADASCDNIPAPANPSATDNCDASPEISLSETSTKGSDPNNCNFYNYTITRTWTASDACGNSSTAAQVITVSDQISTGAFRSPSGC